MRFSQLALMFRQVVHLASCLIRAVRGYFVSVPPVNVDQAFVECLISTSPPPDPVDITVEVSKFEEYRQPDTHNPPTSKIINTTTPMSPPTNLNLFSTKKFAKPVGSGSLKTCLRFGSSSWLGGLLGSKQYCWKHCLQMSERSKTGVAFIRARSKTAHCKQAPKFGSGVLALGVKPSITSFWTLSKNRETCLRV